VKVCTDRPGLFAAEAHGLSWLGETDTLPCPAVLAVDPDGQWLLMDLVPTGLPGAATWEALGRGLAALHRFGAGEPFGLDRDNFIGALPQVNHSCESWVEFWRDRRLEPQLRTAWTTLPISVRSDVDRVLTRLADIVGPEEKPSRLHGDLWSGNFVVDEEGEPWLVDPSVYVGHREVDLAMMRLFGGFHSSCFDAYEEAFPLQTGAEHRVHLYQLYYLLVHVNLFGAGWIGGVQRATEQLV
jgi:fructosamine-3-kinase